MNFSRPIRMSVAAEAAGLSANNIRSWLHRGYIVLNDITSAPAPVHGGFHEISLRGALRIGIIAKLVELGMSPKSANLAAMRFVDSGVGAFEDHNGVVRRVGRLPGELFETGETLLIVTSADGAAIIENTHNDFDIASAMRDAAAKSSGPFIVFPLNGFIEELKQKLGEVA